MTLGLGIAQTELQKMIKDPNIQARINQDLLEGHRVCVKGTPAVYINGRFLRS